MRHFEPIEYHINRNESFRYLGYSGTSVKDEATDALVSECERELLKACSPAGVFREDPIIREEGNPEQISFARGQMIITSHDLAKNLAGCDSAILLAVTLGLSADRLIARYERISMARAAVMQAVAAAAIESWLDAQNEHLRSVYEESGYRLHPRYSPGYGDVSLDCQPDFLRVLDAYRTLGITLREDSGLMVPQKSITAIIGIEKMAND